MQQARAAFEAATGHILVLYADTPLVTSETIAEIVGKLDGGADIVVVGFRPDNPAAMAGC